MYLKKLKVWSIPICYNFYNPLLELVLAYNFSCWFSNIDTVPIVSSEAHFVKGMEKHIECLCVFMYCMLSAHSDEKRLFFCLSIELRLAGCPCLNVLVMFW